MNGNCSDSYSFLRKVSNSINEKQLLNQYPAVRISLVQNYSGSELVRSHMTYAAYVAHMTYVFGGISHKWAISSQTPQSLELRKSMMQK